MSSAVCPAFFGGRLVDGAAELQPEGLDVIGKLKGPLYVVTFVGDFRSGKSYLAARLLGLVEKLIPHSACEPITEGIDVIAWPMANLMERLGKASAEEDMDMHILLLDCQGGSDVSSTLRSLIHGIGSVVSSEIVFVWKGFVSDDGISYLKDFVSARSHLQMLGRAVACQQELHVAVNRPISNKVQLPHQWLAAAFPRHRVLLVPPSGTPDFWESIASLRTQILQNRRQTVLGGSFLTSQKICRLLVEITGKSVDAPTSCGDAPLKKKNKPCNDARKATKKARSNARKVAKKAAW